MDRPKRDKRSTGHGGKREGAGRPPGKNVLPYGARRGLMACRIRVPDDLPEEAKALGDRALQRLIDVMEEDVPADQARAVLSAATRIREEVCGPLAQKLQHSGADGGELVVRVVSYADEGD